MANEPNITAVDENGEPTDEDVLLNGKALGNQEIAAAIKDLDGDGVAEVLDHIEGIDFRNVEVQNLRGVGSTIRVGPDQNLQNVIDEAPPYAQIYGDRTAQMVTEPVTIETEGVELANFNLKLDPDFSANSDMGFIEARAPHVDVHHCRIDGSRNGVSSGVVTPVEIRGRFSRIHHCQVLEGDRHGILGRGQYITVAFNYVRGVNRDCISFEGDDSYMLMALGNWAFDSRDRGCYEVNDGVTNAMIVNNYGENGLYLANCQDHGREEINNGIAVIGNVGRNLEYGFSSNAVSGEFDHNTIVIAMNRFSEIDKTGVQLTIPRDCIVAGNQIHGGGNVGIAIHDAPGSIIGLNNVRGFDTGVRTSTDASEYIMALNNLTGNETGIDDQASETGSIASMNLT